MLVLLLVGVLSVVGGLIWLDQSLNRTPVLADYPDRPPAGRGTNWLLVGSDSRTDLTPEQQDDLATGGDTGAGRTDTMILVHIPALGSSKPTVMLSIPRDSYLSIPDHGEDKINAAFTFGGPKLLAQTVEQATGLRIDHYAEVGFAGFASVVDALGGVTMCPAEPIDDPLAGIDIAAGCQEFDGPTALGFVRTRATPRADLDRVRNQREFMSAMLHRAASPAVWLNPLRMYSLARSVPGSLTVDSGDHVWDLLRLAWALRGDTTTLTIPIGSSTTNSSGAVVLWDDERCERLFTALADDTAVPDDVRDEEA